MRKIQVDEGIILKALPFYDIIDNIVRPAGLISDGVLGRLNESKIIFKLNGIQADTISMSKIDSKTYSNQILLRFCYFDKTCEQEDNFPHDVAISVNNSFLSLPPTVSNPNRPQIPPKRPGKELDITSYCKLSPYAENTIIVKWYVDPLFPQRSYVINVTVVQKLDSINLLERVKVKGHLDAERTRALIIEKLTSDPDCEIATESLQASLVCPLGKMKMTLPCKSLKCQHIPCFDALFYLQMNEKKPTWICPVCSKPAQFQDLMIDGMFMNILRDAPPQSTEIQFHEDGSWSPITKNDDIKKDHSMSDDGSQPPTKKPPVAPIEIVTISDSSDDDGGVMDNAPW